jgi:hypothetical protein
MLFIIGQSVGDEQRSRIGDQTAAGFFFFKTDDFWRDHQKFVDNGVHL